MHPLYQVVTCALMLSIPQCTQGFHCDDFRQHTRETQLMIACKNKEPLATIQALIKKGEGVNAVHGGMHPHAGSPVLRYAIDNHYTEAVKELLSNKADPNVETDSEIITIEKRYNIRNLSLLGHAIKTKVPLAIIKELIKWGAKTNEMSSLCKHWTAINVAEYFRNREALAYLKTIK